MEHFFAVGSPLGVFLAMRDLSKHVDAGHQSAKGLLPHSVCKRIHNIMHPSDPVVSGNVQNDKSDTTFCNETTTVLIFTYHTI